MKVYRVLMLVFALIVGATAAPKRVVFVAGKASHGCGEHEFVAGAELLAKALKESELPIEVDVCREKWPASERLADADAVVVYCDGRKDHLLLGREAELLALSNRGTGIVFLHYAVDGEAGLLDETLLKVVGGRYNDAESSNPIWTVKDPVIVKHAITRGVQPFELKDEWYYNLDFADVTPLLLAVPPEEPQAHALAWTHGDNVFGFTGGHFHSSWAQPDYRKLVLNAIVWSAGVEVPKEGVASADPVVTKHESILHAIARGDAVDTRNHLLLGADVNQKNKQGWTPLHFATVRGKTACAEVLVAKNAKLDERTGTGKTPLHLAADRGFLEIATLLVDGGSDLAARDDEGWTPLHYAAEKDRVEVAAMLIERGAEVDALSVRGGTPLHEASASASPEMIRLLLENGADKSIRATNGKTPLDYAVELENGPAEALLR